MENTFDCFNDGVFERANTSVDSEKPTMQSGAYAAAARTFSVRSSTTEDDPCYPSVSDPNPAGYSTTTTTTGGGIYPGVTNPDPTGGSTSSSTTCGSSGVTPSTIPVTSIVLNTTSIKIPVESSFDLYETVYPANATVKTVRWETNNSSVVSVDRYSGRVTAIAVGQATVYCIAQDGNHAKATCQVTVVSKTPDVTVISATTPGFLNTSDTMGDHMASAIGLFKSHTVKPTTTAAEFSNNWSSSGNCVIIHTHGSPNGLYDGGIDENGNEITPLMISLNEIKDLPSNPNIRFLMIVACATAGGNENDNVACWLSKKIHSEGIVIANRYVIHGTGPTSAGWEEGQYLDGWVVYQNGIRLYLPITLNMEKGYQIYRLFTDSVS